MVSKEDFMNFEWLGCGMRKNTSKQDVSITKRKSGYGIIFRNDTYKVFKNDHIEFAFVNDKTIAFRGASGGYRLIAKGSDEKHKSREITVRVSPDKEKLMDSFVGDYSMNYEKTFDLYYITKQV